MHAPQSTQRQIVLDAMAARAGDPWPRWRGHVVLGIPGSPQTQKAYHEPGGSFSPAPGSLGIAIWFGGQDNAAMRMGDQLALVDIQQRYEWSAANAVPAVATRTPAYDCRWSMTGLDRWELQLAPSATNPQKLGLLLRSVGPAGEPVEHLAWDGRELIVNHRWVVRFDRSDVRVVLGDENTPGWLTAVNNATTCQSASGWGYARIDWPTGGVRMTLRDTAPCFASPLPPSAVKSTLELDLPDESFAASLEAQAANLLMGLVGKQTCPGDPTNYPLAWERDGAYTVVALARCGQVATAKELAVYFAENDFFGGFGAEGDAPGSAINALVSVALISGDAEFQQWCWPHIKRKLGLIAEMLAAKEPLHKTWVGPIVPCHRGKDGLPIICQPACDGLIVGSMDLHYPVLYINAIAYRGLMQAMALARVLGRSDEIHEVPAMATRLRQAWLRNFENKELANERTYMASLWPTWIVEPNNAAFRAELQRRWLQEHGAGTYPRRPLWTYFTLAEAHQWLFLERPDVVWKTLGYFWANQCSPGLFTYWEGETEENGFELWREIRGWVQPPHVTPHYWTAAEMLLLQLDMLAYVDESQAEPVLVVGAGVRPEWLKGRISVRGLPTSVGVVDWCYDNGELTVGLRGGQRVGVRAGSTFGPNIQVTV